MLSCASYSTVSPVLPLYDKSGGEIVSSLFFVSGGDIEKEEDEVGRSIVACMYNCVGEETGKSLHSL